MRSARMIVSFLFCVALACTNAAGGQPDEALGGLVVESHQPPVSMNHGLRAISHVGSRDVSITGPIDVSLASDDPEELLRATRISHQRAGEILGSHRVRSTSKVEVRDRAQVLDSLSVETSIAYRDREAYRAVLENSADYGRQVVYFGGFLYLAPRYGKFHRRRPERADEPAVLRNEFFAEVAAHFELLVHGIAVRSTGEVEYSGRRAVAVKIAAAAGSRPVQPQPYPRRAWRESVRVLAAGGEFLIDTETGLVLQARLLGRVSASRNERELTVHVAAEHAIIDIGESIEIAAPPADRWVNTPLRSRELDEREILLRGIAPPVRRQSGGSSSVAPSSPRPEGQQK